MLHSNTPPVEKVVQMITLPNSLRRVSAAENHTTEQYSNTGRIKIIFNIESISQRAFYHSILARTSSKCQPFEELLWKPSEDASLTLAWDQLLIPLYQGHQTLSAQFRQ